MSDTKDLKTLGGNTNYVFDKPDAGILETFENQHPNKLYVTPFSMPEVEFSSLCPMTGQPDWARVEIIYIPNDLMIESKSLKLYLFSFRNHGEFHEDCMNRIANDIYDLIKPKYLRVFGDFNPRGGIAIKPLAFRGDIDNQTYINMVNQYDNIK